MANITRSRRLAKKGHAALVAAIEIYNKPDFTYREESFAILCVNAWELLLKAKIVENSGQELKSIFIYDNKHNKNGITAKKKTLRKNGAGSPMTIGISRAVDLLGAIVPGNVKSNLDGLIHIRDNAVHFVNPGFDLRKRIHELGSAAIENFLALAKQWFGLQDIAKLNLYLLPIGFVSIAGLAKSVAPDADEGRLLVFLTELIKKQEDNSPFNVALDVGVHLTRATAANTALATKAQLTNNPVAVKLFLSDAQIKERYPWTYAELCTRLKARYTDFKVAKKFHDLRNQLAPDPKFSYDRFLDPGNPKSGRKTLYNPNIQGEFDNHYTKKP